ncbi:MAG TPA: hypothetical protein VN969_02420 [Streptosporangiaceae bacterium]|jgi:hypothetical protein|nr:hypothetical protein [Streptosporangiaceae bacterium]
MGSGYVTVKAITAVPGIYSDLSHVIAVVTISMAAMALVRLRPAVKRRIGQRRISQRRRALSDGNADYPGPVSDIG